jgi:hypothetical protein
MTRVAAILLVLCATARAQPAAPDPDADSSAEPSDPLDDRITDLEARLHTLEQTRRARFPIRISGYGDLGWFAAGGDGTGWRRDAGHVMFPEYADRAWVFYGDLLATPVNSRGEAADLGNAPGVDRQDSVHAGGHPTFLVNELNVTVSAGLGERALFTASTNFTPRSGVDFRLGDSVDVDVVQLEYMPTADGKTSLFVGKVDSVVGIEYKTRKPPQRFGITPSLVARYTTGTAVGVKVRSKLANEHLIVAAAVTNGSFGTEQFHFYRELDTNSFKTLSGRVALRFPVGQGGLFEAGPSGSWGTQDGAPDGAGKLWFAGFDAELDTGRIDLKAQYLIGAAPGDAASMTYALDLRGGGYVEADLVVTPILGLLGRAEFRDARVTEGAARLYITKSWRATAGVRLVLSPNTIVKAEVLHNGEYGGVPSIPDDVVTTSGVFSF